MIYYNLTTSIQYKDQTITQLALYPLSFKTLSVSAKIRSEINMFLVKMAGNTKLNDDDKQKAKKQAKLQAEKEKTSDEKIDEAKSYIQFGLDVSVIIELLIKHELIKIVIRDTEAVVLVKEGDFDELTTKDAEELVVTYLANFL